MENLAILMHTIYIQHKNAHVFLSCGRKVLFSRCWQWELNRSLWFYSIHLTTCKKWHCNRFCNIQCKAWKTWVQRTLNNENTGNSKRNGCMRCTYSIACPSASTNTSCWTGSSPTIVLTSFTTLLFTSLAEEAPCLSAMKQWKYVHVCVCEWLMIHHISYLLLTTATIFDKQFLFTCEIYIVHVHTSTSYRYTS